MATIQQFQYRIAAITTKLPTNNTKITVETKAQVKLLIREYTGYQKELRQIKREVAEEIKLIHGKYREKSSSAQNTGAAIGMLFGKRKLGGSMSASMKHQAAARRDADIRPYEIVKTDIDKLILYIDSVKLQIDKQTSGLA